MIDSDNSIAFAGRTQVHVIPHSDGTADLRAEQNRDGWHPSLVNAEVKPFIGSRRGGGCYGTSNGLTCLGADRDGNPFIWYINGAADNRISSRPPDFDPSTLPPEEEVEES